MTARLDPAIDQRNVRRPRPLTTHPSMSGVMIVTLTRGHHALIDAADGPLIGQFNWYVLLEAGRQTAYAASVVGPRKARMKLHRFLWKAWGLEMVPELDHINGNGLDCRRSNLRVATRSQNVANTGLSSRNTSGYKGILWHSARRRWEARIEVNGRVKQVGSFLTPEEAAAAYAVAARVAFGEFARVPLPPDMQTRLDAARKAGG